MAPKPTSSASYLQHRPKELRRLYEPLALLCALRRQIAEQRSIQSEGDGGWRGALQHYRDFLDALVRLATIKQGYNLAITAVKDGEEVIILVAGNQDVTDDVVPFLNTMLEMVTRGRHASTDGETRNSELLNISNYAMSCQNDNIFAIYQRLFVEFAPVCIPEITARLQKLEGNPHYSLDFPDWFKDHFFGEDRMALLETDMPALVRNCFSAYQEGRFEIFERLIRQGDEFTERFEEFYQLLRDLVMPIEMCDLLFESAIAMWQDLEIEIDVRHVPPSERMRVPLVKSKLNLESIANRMFSDGERFEQLSKSLRLHVPLPTRLIEQLKHYQETGFTQVHPELRVVDYFDKDLGLQYFGNGGMYIATSKPCCFLCSQYMAHRRNHHIRESDPNDIDIQWRLPDILDVESIARFEEQRIILRKITERIRTDAESLVLSCRPESSELTDDDSSQSTSPSIETDMVAQELSDMEIREYPNPSRCPPSIGSGEHPSVERWHDSDNEDDGEIVVFKGRQRHDFWSRNTAFFFFFSNLFFALVVSLLSG
ncbi:hypothetical protein BDV26DRAFT_295608 [Aspergillus bertholletiae]|uniref:Uncharacterized protein n=1 Tax=Aspergillus bertholletiae TaxID=1226010 RepID=A0A5N7B141_9EURO|nr:hypothetical protein BDV26DRAFT_295608 [Aspergillus bertholletiae]